MPALLLTAAVAVAHDAAVPTYTKLPSGNWRVFVKHKSQRDSAVRPTRSEAVFAGAELLVKMGVTPGGAHTTTVEELVALYLETAPLSITYKADCLSAIKHIPDVFNERRLFEVTTLVIEALYRNLKKKSVSAHRVHRIHSILSASWTMAQRYGWASTNPFTVAGKPAVPESGVRPPTDDELDAIIAHTPEVLLLYVEVAETVGARRGENVALQWADITDDEITVRRAISYAGGKAAITEGKSGRKGHRNAAIDPVLANHLRTHRLEQVELALASGLPSPVWVFSHDAGVHPWRPEWPTKQFAKIRTAAKVPNEVKLHGLRHLMATRLLAAGYPLKGVSERLGHRRLATTSDRYGHAVRAVDQALAAEMAAQRRSGRSS